MPTPTPITIDVVNAPVMVVYSGSTIYAAFKFKDAADTLTIPSGFSHRSFNTITDVKPWRIAGSYTARPEAAFSFSPVFASAQNQPQQNNQEYLDMLDALGL